MRKNDFNELPIADKLSLLLRDPNLPENLQEVILEEMNNMFNKLPPETYQAMESSPEYIEMLIRGGSVKNAEEDEAPEPWPEFF